MTLNLAAGANIQAQTQTAGRYYAPTDKTLSPEFLNFYDSKGGLPIFGYPLTEPETEGGFKVQYLERARIEYHPEHRGTPHEVQLGLLGNVLTEGRQFVVASESASASAPNVVYFPETKHTLSGAFLDYWRAHGGLVLFGYPISEPIEEGGYTVQYFERNRFEYHPENTGTQYAVLLGLLGRDVLNQRVKIGESSVSIPTYGYEQGYTAPPSGALGGYPGLDMSKVAPPQPRTYKLITLENRYLKLSVLPQLGGRLYEAIYKPTGHNELYKNPVVKPAPFGPRGWWLGVGGTEWAFPTDEHGLLEYLPWEAAAHRQNNGGAAVTVSATDRLTGLNVVVEIGLNPEESAYTISARMDNRTSTQQKGQLWANTMLAPGGTNHLSPNTRFILPTKRLVVHSTGDSGLPAASNVVQWPVHNGRDLSDMATWKGWFGGFALPDANRGSFAAVYNPDADEGMVKTFEGGKMPGLKLFGYGPGFNPQVYTDDDSAYVELWGGATPTFWDNAVLPPGGSVGWTERWQPVARMGGVSLAGEWGTVSVECGMRSAECGVRVLPVRRIEGATLVARGPNGETRLMFSAYPDRAVSIPVSGPVSEITIQGADGRTLLKGAPLSYR